MSDSPFSSRFCEFYGCVDFRYSDAGFIWDRMLLPRRRGRTSTLSLRSGPVSPHYERRAPSSSTDESSHIEGGEAINLGEKDKKAAKNAEEKTVQIELPDTYEDAWDIIHRFEKGDPVNESISDSVGHCAFRGGGSLLDEKWSGTEDSERQAFVQEELYIHTKVCGFSPSGTCLQIDFDGSSL